MNDSRLLLLLALLLTVPVTALAANVELDGARARLDGDLLAGQTDRVSFLAGPRSRLTVELETKDGDLRPTLRIVGPDGPLDPGRKLKAKDGGRRLRLKNLRLPAGGVWLLEIGGSGAGAYEFRARVKASRRAKVKGTGMPLTVAVPPGAQLDRIRVTGSKGEAASFVSLEGPDGSSVAAKVKERKRGFEVRPEESAGAGLYRLSVGGSASPRANVRFDIEDDEDEEAHDLSDDEESESEEEDDDFVGGEVLVRLSGAADLEELTKRLGSDVIREIPGTSFALITVPAGKGDDDFLEELLDDSEVVFAEKDRRAESPEGGQSNVPILDDNLDEQAFLSQPGLGMIGIPAAHVTARGNARIVAVLDTGVDPDHPFFAGRILPGGFDFVDFDGDPREERNGIDDDQDGWIDEGHGHGTFVAGLVLAVAPDARVLPIRVLDSDAHGRAAFIAEAIHLAVDQGADVINLSLGTVGATEVIKQGVEFARDRGVLVVVAAGNRGQDVQFPARYGNTVAVTAVDGGGVAAPFTNRGSAADLAAPGVSLIGPVPTDTGVLYSRWSGTSFAAPLVSGSLALVLDAHPGLRDEDIVNRLLDTAEDIEPQNPVLGGKLGKGLLRADLAVR